MAGDAVWHVSRCPAGTDAFAVGELMREFKFATTNASGKMVKVLDVWSLVTNGPLAFTTLFLPLYLNSQERHIKL